MQKIADILAQIAQKVDFWSIYILKEQHEELSIRQGIEEPINFSHDLGATITIMKDGAIAHGFTQNFSLEGIKKAYNDAYFWIDNFKAHSLLKDIKINFQKNQERYISPHKEPLLEVDLREKLDLLIRAEKILRKKEEIVDSQASLWGVTSQSWFFNSLGAKIEQEFYKIIPSLQATAYKNGVSQTRTLGGMRAYCRQGGFLDIKNIDLENLAIDIAKDAIDLVNAPNCPQEKLDLVINPDQMMLQIHESIGHPLELDRILGDERNYAGTSFVTLDMFGKYQYGSNLLNITFDPTIKEQFASYGFDDEGTKATKEFLIKDGLLVRPLGGLLSQSRASKEGVANARSSSWNRPPIDRMANLNLEPGTSSFLDIIASVKYGLYIKSNSSWSIDDSRNKFQFGCEWGQLIENGKLTKVVRNPNYRGISANFWRNLDMVGDASTFLVMGTPFCGKGEPNQSIDVGHASPVCKFSNIDVFGGE